MHHREITLPDGRYMIFYTFGTRAEDGAAPLGDAGVAATNAGGESGDDVADDSASTTNNDV